MSDNPSIADEVENLDDYRIIGAKARAAARLLDWRLANFDRYVQSAGAAQFFQEINLSPIQLVAFEDGYRNITIKKQP